MSEPIKDGSELDEAEEREGEFFVARADAPKTLQPAETIFDVVTLAIVTAMKRQRTTSLFAGGNAHPNAQAAQTRGEAVRIKTLVADEAAAAQQRQERRDGVLIMLRPGRQAQCDHAAASIHGHGQLGVEPALGAADGLRVLEIGRASCRERVYLCV